ncbi:DDE-type integrase/transposase/recombinase [Yersinia rochesterensis]|uniref:Integrase catalytic domain-containing protein n=1 Tax=Yersinia rochesterensis TaxID=1604335 RepID=A0A8D4SR01_9GAMM|nr:hypothetical protein DXZ79_11340 [Yersinia rochesterensis]
MVISGYRDGLIKKNSELGFLRQPDSDLTVRALRLAVNKRRPTGSVVFHSDQGEQYTRTQFQSCQQELDVTGRMSRKGNCLDNAVTERFSAA